MASHLAVSAGQTILIFHSAAAVEDEIQIAAAVLTNT